ncbi:MAG: DUF2141 domain-containing protein [Verrucomicrobiales bacterium]|nr:DUF2141 domain-containing protein [Verrucomicrobiales bacterium]
MMKYLITAFLLIFSVCSQAADVEVIVHGVDRPGGTLMVGFYNNASDFRVNELPESPKVPVKAPGPVITTARNLPPGLYAVAVVWDTNGNGVLDTKGRFKIPVEPYGFSNNPKTRFGPPEFAKCVFRVPENGGRIEVFLK